MNDKSFYAYFIYYSHEATSEPKITITKEKGKDQSNFELKNWKIEYENNSKKYISYIYGIKFFQEKIEKKGSKGGIINITLDEKYKFPGKVEVNDINRSNCMFNFKFDSYKGKRGTYSPPRSIQYTVPEQFELFKDFFRKTLKIKQNVPENDALIIDTQKQLAGKGVTFPLEFYISIFKECYTTSKVKSLFLMFQPEKIKETKTNELKTSEKFLGMLEKNPKLIFKNG